MAKAYKQSILIVDDSAFNRDLLSAILEEHYNLIEAADGVEAMKVLDERSDDIAMMLLDIVMPNMDGFEVLLAMHGRHLIERIPVIMISSEDNTNTMRHAYNLGVTDYINRPFDAEIVLKRISNTMQLYAKQQRLVEMVTEEMYAKKRSNSMMISILSNIVEIRNGESGMHVLHVNLLTRILLRAICQKTDRYQLSEDEIDNICMASAMHDIGKIVIPDAILNKPGRLTKEEFEVMKKHSAAGADLIKSVPFDEKEPLLVAAMEICRWHHERYDGRGYPDGLVGEAIPIGAQIVGLADVYDALTSPRVYKPAYSHETALRMILDGECGVFNPLLIECFLENVELIRNEMRVMSNNTRDKMDIVERTMRRLEQEIKDSL